MSIDDIVAPTVSMVSLPVHADRDAMSAALHLLGDRWSLLLLREIGVGNNRYGEILSALPGISRGLLSSRLRHMERAGLLVRTATAGDRRSPHRYLLTAAGADLSPVMDSLARWSLGWINPIDGGAQLSVSGLLEQVGIAVNRNLLPGGHIRIGFQAGNAPHESGCLSVDHGGVRIALGPSHGEFDLIVSSSLRVLNDLWSRRRSCENAIGRRDISFDGPTSYARAFSSWFPQRPGDGAAKY